MAGPTREQRISGIRDPGYLLYLAVKSFVLVCLETILRRNRQITEIKDEAFSRFWRLINPPKDPNEPLVGSQTLIPPLLATAAGDVLELGPGSGEQIQYFKPATQVRRIYGAEPVLPLHDDIQANARRHGLGDRYFVVTAGAEKATLIPGLAKAGLLEKKSPGSGVFDTVVCVRVLCSVQDLHETAGTVYQLLKPGGKLLICEHTVNPWTTSKGSYIARAFQFIYSALGWTFFVGNCHITRDIRRAVTEAAVPYGGWARVDLTDHFGWSVLPYVSGTLVKRG